MSQEIINVLNYLGEQLGVAIDWTSENVWPQVMDILERYRLFEIISASLWLLAEIIMLVIAIVIFKKIIENLMQIKQTNKDNFWWISGYRSIDMTGFGTTLFVVGILLVVFSVIGIPVDIGLLLKWIIVPEIKYMEMLKGLMG